MGGFCSVLVVVSIPNRFSVRNVGGLNYILDYFFLKFLPLSIIFCLNECLTMLLFNVFVYENNMKSAIIPTFSAMDVSWFHLLYLILPENFGQKKTKTCFQI